MTKAEAPMEPTTQTQTNTKLNPNAPEFFPYSFYTSTTHQIIPISITNSINNYLNYPSHHHHHSTSSSSNLPLNNIPASSEPKPSEEKSHFTPETQVATTTTTTNTRTQKQRGLKSSHGRGYCDHKDQNFTRRKWSPRAKTSRCNFNSYNNGHRKANGNCFKDSKRRAVLPLQHGGQNTSIMIRNIPNRYTRELIMEFLDNHCMEENQKAKLKGETTVSAYDFLYLPVDFKKGANLGYAFVNFTEAIAVWRFYKATNNQSWGLFHSNKIRQITSARIQGKEELVRHVERSKFYCESDNYLPVCFSPPRDGSNMVVKQRTIGIRVGNQI